MAEMTMTQLKVTAEDEKRVKAMLRFSEKV